MARIRSVHPGLASDEAYMQMSMAAKAAWPILWTECDDHGVFEWKPIVLKARIFPANNVDFAEVLREYIDLGCVCQGEIDGRPYGFVRNFCKFQRPKNPSYRYSLPPGLESFVGVKAARSDTPTPSLPQEGVSPTEKPPQMKEEGGRREEVVPSSLRSDGAAENADQPKKSVDSDDPIAVMFDIGTRLWGSKDGGKLVGKAKKVFPDKWELASFLQEIERDVDPDRGKQMLMGAVHSRERDSKRGDLLSARDRGDEW